MALNIFGQALFFAIATAMGLWMQGYVKMQIAVNGPSVLVPQNRTEPAEFYSEKFGTHAYVAANNITFHYVTKGCGLENRTMLLFLHGFLDFWFIWNRQIPELGEQFCVVAPDMRGYGKTTRPNDTAEYVMPKLIEDVKGLLDKLSKYSL